MENNGEIFPGSIINLRSRLWRVDNISNNILTATTVEGVPIEKRRFYLPLEFVTPDKLENPDPNKVGNPSAQDLLIRAHRLSMIHGTAPLLSLQRSRVVAEPFQMVPVILSLDMPRVRMLIADDVGLGKTIEAGLIVTEMVARQVASRLLVICPANLREQWKEALSYFFHIDAEIISTQHLRTLERNIPPGTSPWDYYPYLIVSMDYAKSAQIKAQLLERDWDIILIDEAHNLAKPHQVSESHVVRMDRWVLGRDIAGKCKHLLLLTATPHNGYTDTFASLLSLLDVGIVSGPSHQPQVMRERARRFVCQRRRKDVEEDFRSIGEISPFPKRMQNEEYVRLSPDETEAILKVEDLGNHILITAGTEKKHRFRIAKWTVVHFHKRALSSPAALRISLKRRLNVVNERLKNLNGSDEVPITEDEARSEVLDHDTGDRLSDEEAGERLDRTVLSYDLALKKEKEILEEASELAKSITPSKDSKLQQLCGNVLREMIRRDPKVIIFTRYVDTLNYLGTEIPNHRHFKNTKVITLYGQLNDAQRKERLKEFETAKEAVLIATDCLSEGINLQYMAAQVIHYELPWNPNRLEQRNGRVDRYGQHRTFDGEKKVFIKTMVVNDSLEAGILRVLVEKANRIREDHGFSPPFFGDDLSVLDLIHEKGLEVRLGQTTMDHFFEHEEKKHHQDPFSDDTIKRMENDNFYGQSSVDLSIVKQRMKETETLVGSSEEIRQFVQSGLNKFNSRMIPNVGDNTYKIEIHDERLHEGLEGGTIQRASFDPLRGHDDPDLDVIDLGHPLVRNLIELVKELTFRSDETYGRTAAICTASADSVSVVHTFLARYAIHTQPVTIVEELLTIGKKLYSEDILPPEKIQELQNSLPLPDRRTEHEIREDLARALSGEAIRSLMREMAEERCKALIEERGQVKAKLSEDGHHEWLEGIDNVSRASEDLLCSTIYYPDPRGGTQ